MAVHAIIMPISVSLREGVPCENRGYVKNTGTSEPVPGKPYSTRWAPEFWTNTAKGRGDNCQRAEKEFGGSWGVSKASNRGSEHAGSDGLLCVQTAWDEANKKACCLPSTVTEYLRRNGVPDSQTLANQLSEVVTKLGSNEDPKKVKALEDQRDAILEFQEQSGKLIEEYKKLDAVRKTWAGEEQYRCAPTWCSANMECVSEDMCGAKDPLTRKIALLSGSGVGPACMAWCEANPGDCDTLKQAYCEENPDADECGCLLAKDQEDFKALKKSELVPSTAPWHCWYSGCLGTNVLRLSTQANENCEQVQTQICAQVINETDGKLNDLEVKAMTQICPNEMGSRGDGSGGAPAGPGVAPKAPEAPDDGLHDGKPFWEWSLDSNGGSGGGEGSGVGVLVLVIAGVLLLVVLLGAAFRQLQ